MSTRDLNTPKEKRGEPGICGCKGKISCTCGWWMTHCGLPLFGSNVIFRCPYCGKEGDALQYVDFDIITWPGPLAAELRVIPA